MLKKRGVFHRFGNLFQEAKNATQWTMGEGRFGAISMPSGCRGTTARWNVNLGNWHERGEETRRKSL
jgi:hypothetical protein